MIDGQIWPMADRVISHAQKSCYVPTTYTSSGDLEVHHAMATDKQTFEKGNFGSEWKRAGEA